MATPVMKTKATLVAHYRLDANSIFQ